MLTITKLGSCAHGIPFIEDCLECSIDNKEAALAQAKREAETYESQLRAMKARLANMRGIS